jgi:hypothetical protein
MPQYPIVCTEAQAAKWFGIKVDFPPPSVVPPTNTTAPVISGATNLGSVLTCAPGTWTGSPTLAYQWLRDGANIAGATGLTRTILATDQGTTLSCRETGTNSAGNASATSNGIAIPAAAPPAPVITPATFALTLPANLGDPVGTMTATNSPTSWAITGGNASGFYQISNGGVIVVTAAGAAGITAGQNVLTITATNAGGTSTPANATINIS